MTGADQSPEDVFSKEPLRRMIGNGDQADIIGNKQDQLFSLSKFNLNELDIENGLPIGGTPMSTDTNERVYLKSHEAFDILDKVNAAFLSVSTRSLSLHLLN